MILDVKMLKEEDNVHIELEDNTYEITDTIDDWILKGKNSNAVGVFSKFSTISILLYEENNEDQ